VRLATLLLMLPDLAEARRFYGEVLGFPVLRESAEMLVLEHPGANLHIFRCAGPAPDAGHGDAAAQVFVFEVEDIEAAMRDLRGKGVVFLHAEPARNAFGLYAAFQAPGGLVHEIFETLPAP